MGDLTERERGLFRDWAVRKPWTPGEKRPDDRTLPPADGNSDEDPVLDAFNALAATEVGDGETEEATAAEAEPAVAAEATPEASGEEQPVAVEGAPGEADAEAPPIPAVAASMPEGSWNPEPVRAGRQKGAAGSGGLSHVNERGEARMVDVTEKEDTDREAVAEGYVTMQASTLKLVMGGGLAKGDVLATARIAGIMAAKRTSELVPMCHPLPITGVTVDLEASGEGRLHIIATVRTTGKTGVEMEALTAVTVAGLTVYDMAKAVDRGMRIESVRLLEKRGGKSGEWKAG
jgi:cyclic pyranopterin phosphate synthase